MSTTRVYSPRLIAPYPTSNVSPGQNDSGPSIIADNRCQGVPLTDTSAIARSMTDNTSVHALPQSEHREPTIIFRTGITRKSTELIISSMPPETRYVDRFRDLQDLFDVPLDSCLHRAKLQPYTLSIDLMMLHKTTEPPTHWIVVQCEARIVKKVRKWFKQEPVREAYNSGPESLNPSFQLLVLSPPIYALGSPKHDRVLAKRWPPLRTLCGQKIQGGPDARVATIGGVIKITWNTGETDLYCLTVGHIFADAPVWAQPQSLSSDTALQNSDNNVLPGILDLANDDSDSDSEEEACYHLKLPDGITGTNVMDSQRKAEDETPSNHEMIGLAQPNRSNMHNYDPFDLDWMFFRLVDPSKYRQNWSVRSNNSHLDLDIIQDPPRVRSGLPGFGRPAIVINNGDSHVACKLSSSPSFIRFPGGRKLIETYKLCFSKESEGLNLGDCGSWVVDAVTGHLYGHVVAANAFKMSYAIPMDAIFERIRHTNQAVHVGVPDYKDFMTHFGGPLPPPISPSVLNIPERVSSSSQHVHDDSEPVPESSRIVTPAKGQTRHGRKDVILENHGIIPPADGPDYHSPHPIFEPFGPGGDHLGGTLLKTMETSGLLRDADIVMEDDGRW